MKAEDTFCSVACKALACSRCQGRLETHEVERQVYDIDREIEMDCLGEILQRKGVCEPLPFDEQLNTYHPRCRSKVRCCAACQVCQEKRLQCSTSATSSRPTETGP